MLVDVCANPASYIDGPQDGVAEEISLAHRLTAGNGASLRISRLTIPPGLRRLHGNAVLVAVADDLRWFKTCLFRQFTPVLVGSSSPFGTSGPETPTTSQTGVAVFEVNDIREWRNHDVIDASGRKIGTLESVYVDTASDQPAFATVTIGMPTRRRLAFVPLAGASVGPGYLKVGHSQKQVKQAPTIDTDGELPAEHEPAVFAHYELAYAPGARGERRLARR